MKEESLFSLANQNENTPLADRVRPQNLDDFVGQENLIGHGKILRDLKFAFTVGVHIIFPAFSIGLAAYLAVLEGSTR